MTRFPTAYVWSPMVRQGLITSGNSYY